MLMPHPQAGEGELREKALASRSRDPGFLYGEQNCPRALEEDAAGGRDNSGY